MKNNINVNNMKNAILKVAYCAMATAMFTACASDDDFAERKQKADEIFDLSGRASEIPVSFNSGASSAQTSSETLGSKAGIIDSNVENKAFACEDLGIFMLAKGLTPDNPYSGLTTTDVNWANHDKEVNLSKLKVKVTDNWSANIWNAQAVSRLYDATGKQTQKLADAAGSRLAFSNANHYYPIGNYCAYEFYGYAPFKSLTAANHKVEQKKLTINMEVNGKDDVIWGCARYVKGDQDGSVDGTAITYNKNLPITYDDGTVVSDYEPYAYSAKFFRFAEFRTPLVKNDDGTTSGDEPLAPTMKFKHKLMMFKFNVIAGGTALDDDVVDKNYERAYKTTVTGLNITNAPTSFDLVVADNSTSNQRGQIINVKGEKALPIPGFATPQKGADGKPVITPVKNGEEDSYIILPVKPASGSYYTLQLTLTDSNNPDKPVQTLTVPYILQLKDGMSFEEGYIYYVTLKIFNMEKINLETTCEKWKEMDITDIRYPFVTEKDGTIPVY